MTADAPRARSLLGQPELAWLVERCRTRLERGQPLHGAVTLATATSQQRDAVDRLLGRRPTSGTSLRLDLDHLAQVLRQAGIAERLQDAVTAVTGPVDDLAAERAAETQRWDELFTELSAEVGAHPGLVTFVGDLRASGLLSRIARGDADTARTLVSRALHVLAALPVDGVPLARFAADTAHNSHALDRGRPLATLVLRGLEHVTGDVRGDRRAEERRALWARVGVLCDELSGAVLVLGLRGRGSGTTDAVLGITADAGEPARLTLRQLVRDPPRLTAATVWLCENPAVVASAADALGAACPPLVCTDGQPSGAVQTLLRQVREAGGELRVHTDLDWGGLRITNFVIERFGAAPWRLSAADYLASPTGVRLSGTPVEARWDADLTPMMIERGTRVLEEQVLDDIITDLHASVA